MSILTAPRPDVKLTTLTIKGHAYSVRPIPPGEFGTSAVRLTKLASGEAYDIIRRHDGLVACDCPSYVATFEGTAGTCKHGVAAMNRGLLPAPASGGSPAVEAPRPVPAAVAPVTAADLKRARFFHLKIPAPLAVESSAPAVEATPAVEPAPADEDGSWDDDYRWELGPEADFVAEPARVEARPTDLGRVRQSEEDEAIAAVLFADNRPGAYFVAGRPIPPIGDRSFPRKAKTPRYNGTGMTDSDVHPHGVC